MYKSLFAAAVLVVLSCVGSSGTAGAAQLVNSSGGCADIQRNDTSDGTPMLLFHCHGTPNENWVLSGGTLSGENSVCLDVSGSAPRVGALIIVVQCNGRPSQKWQVINGQIVGIGNLCIDLQGGNTDDKTPLVLGTCNATSPGQQWNIE
jgi:hypothetical protein